MQAFLVSTGVVALAEIGDKTQLLSLVLAARYRQPLPIIAGILAATLLNHGLAGALGAWLTTLIGPSILRISVGVSFLLMAGWTLIPDKLEDVPKEKPGVGVFLATLTAFFLAEMGDKTQIATIALAAKYGALIPVVLGTTVGMMLANVPVIFLGDRAANKLPLKAVRAVAASLFAILGILALLPIRS
jgi:putative Ca2+/H+ antiporter (TMEM165/GDT1 family)